MRYTLYFGESFLYAADTVSIVSFAYYLKSIGKQSEWDNILVWDEEYKRRSTISTIMKELS